MSSILDIDLDYFRLVEDPLRRFEKLLKWGEAPIAIIVEKHHKAFTRWEDRVKRGTLASPSHILHVDEHHDMMDQRRNANIANFMYHAIRTWPLCRVHWLTERPIMDSPRYWLDDDVWESFSQRFSVSPHRPRRWPKPDLVSVCSSPGFLSEGLRQILLNVAQRWVKPKRRQQAGEVPTKPLS
ncbi:MAG: hypothetical protein ACYSWU_06320 [Planctomycetota bacterium]